MTQYSAPPVVLTIAGFDPTAGAGIGADLKTIAANHGYGVACITALTVQNTQRTDGFQVVQPEFLSQQLDFLLGDVRPQAVKIGMLANAAIVEVVAQALERHPAPWVVLDPILYATSGCRLLDVAGVVAMKSRLCPLVSVVTPNIREAEDLAETAIQNVADMEKAAVRLHGLGVQWAVVTGGHLERPVDVVYNGERATVLSTERVRTPNTHGTGCTFSSAVATNLALGKRVEDAVVLAKAYVSAALKNSYGVGEGRGPLNHLYRLQEPATSRNVDPAPQHFQTTR